MGGDILWRSAAALLLLAGTSQAADLTIPGPEGIALKSRLFEPVESRAAPGIILLHGCGGPFPVREVQWIDGFTKAGHVVLLPDSFSSRGLGSQCNVPERQRVATPTGLRRLDALAAANWLAVRSGTPPGGVVIMGWSNGGATTLAVGADQPDTPKGLIRGLIAFYPGCASATRSPGLKPVAPLLVLVGEADDWTPAAPCHALANSLGSAMTLVTYPGAYHDFDAPDYAIRTRSSSVGLVHVGTDPVARADALQRVPAFIARLPPAN
jgi:dienelactone hydrolase